MVETTGGTVLKNIEDNIISTEDINYYTQLYWICTTQR